MLGGGGVSYWIFWCMEDILFITTPPPPHPPKKGGGGIHTACVVCSKLLTSPTQSAPLQALQHFPNLAFPGGTAAVESLGQMILTVHSKANVNIFWLKILRFFFF